MGTDGQRAKRDDQRHVRFLTASIVLTLVVMNVTLAVFTTLFLRARRLDAEGQAAATTQSIAHALDGSLSNAAQVTKLALRMVVNECERELKSTGRIDPATLDAYFDIMRASLPAGALLHATDRRGRVIMGAGIDASHPPTYADRDFFAALMNERTPERIRVTNRLVGRATHMDLVAFVARYDGPDGRPAGVVSIAVPVTHFRQLLQVPRLGAHGIALLRDASTALVATNPPSPVDAVGNRHFSPQLARAIASGQREQTFHATRTGDGIERIDSYRRLSGLPFHLVVGMASADYLATWRTTRRWVVLAQLGFFIVSVAFAAMLWAAVRRVDAAQRHEALRARRDVLTALPNRLALQEHLPGALARARRGASVIAVGMVDLDDFKAINDTHGHAGGDQLLIELSRRFQRLVREGDFVARLGGDEFVFVFEGLAAGEALRAQLDCALQRLHRAVEEPFDVAERHRVSIGMSMGIALFPRDGEHADALLRGADVVMYRIKQAKSRRGRWWAADFAP